MRSLSTQGQTAGTSEKSRREPGMAEVGSVAQLKAAASPPEPEALKELVLSVIQGEQDYQALLNVLEPVTLGGQGLQGDTALTLALLLEEVEQQAELNDQLHALVKDQGAPALALTESGVILAQNPAAQSLFGTSKGDGITRLGVSTQGFADFQQRIFQYDGPTLLRTFPPSLLVSNDDLGNDNTLPVIFIGLYNGEHQTFLLRAIECQWPESIDKALEDIFQLTDAERDILAGLAQGMNSEQISHKRNRAVGTVRQQIKSLLGKLGASSQVQAVALASAIGSQNYYQQGAHSAPQEALSGYPLELGELMRGPRRVGWRRYGKKGGQPVLLLHGAYFGAGEYPQDREWASRHGLDVIVPERLGYGRTQPPGKGEQTLATQIEDCVAVLDALGLSRVRLASHDGGFIHALALANRHPERASNILAISPLAPFQDKDSLDYLPRQHRVFMWAARHAFWSVRLLIRLGMVQMRKLGPERWMEAVFEGVPYDLEVLQAPSRRQGMLGTYGFNLNQVGKGYELDLELSMATDWAPLVQQVKVPVLGLMGGRNQTSPPGFVRGLQKLNPAIALEEIPDAGQTLCLTHVELCFRLLAERTDGEV